MTELTAKEREIFNAHFKALKDAGWGINESRKVALQGMAREVAVNSATFDELKRAVILLMEYWR